MAPCRGKDRASRLAHTRIVRLTGSRRLQSIRRSTHGNGRSNRRQSYGARAYRAASAQNRERTPARRARRATASPASVAGRVPRQSKRAGDGGSESVARGEYSRTIDESYRDGTAQEHGAEIAKRPNLDEVPYSSVLAWAITDGSEKPTQSWLYAQCQQAGLQMPRDFMEVEVYSNGRPTAALKFWKRTHNETDAMEYFLTREDDKFFLSAYKEAGLITAMKALQPVLSRGVMGVPPNATIAIRTLPPPTSLNRGNQRQRRKSRAPRKRWKRRSHCRRD